MGNRISRNTSKNGTLKIRPAQEEVKVLCLMKILTKYSSPFQCHLDLSQWFFLPKSQRTVSRFLYSAVRLLVNSSYQKHCSNPSKCSNSSNNNSSSSSSKWGSSA